MGLKEHWKSIVAVLAATGLGVAGGYVLFNKGQQPAKEVKYKVHSDGEKIKLANGTVLQLNLDNLEGKVGNKTVSYPLVLEKIKGLNKDNDAASEFNLVNPIAKDGTTNITNNANNSAYINNILSQAGANISAKDVKSITINSYLGKDGVFAVYQINKKDNSTLTVLGKGINNVYDLLDNGEKDNSFANVEAKIHSDGKSIGADLEKIVQIVPDKYTGTFSTLKQWANETYNIIYTGDSAKELLQMVKNKIDNQTGPVADFTKAKDAIQAYINFVGNEVKWNTKYGDFTALNKTVKALTSDNIANKTNDITAALDSIMGKYIDAEKKNAINGAKAGIENAVYDMLWNGLASDIGVSADLLKAKFGSRNQTAMQELELKHGLVQAMQNDIYEKDFLNHMKVNAKDVYTNWSVEKVLDTEAAAEAYAEFAHQFNTNLTASKLLNETGNARTGALESLQYIAGQYNWLGGWYNKTVNEELTDKIASNASLANTTWGKAIMKLSNFGADKIEVYKTSDGQTLIQGYQNGNSITKAGKEGAYADAGAVYDTIKNL